MRLEAVTECEHGKVGIHFIDCDCPKPLAVDDLHDSHGRCLGGSRRVASTTDLIEELKAKGATVRQATGEPGWYDVRSHWEIEVDREGSYLVFSLEGEKP